MVSRILKIAIFLGLLIIGDRLLARMLDRVVMSSQFRYSRLYSGDCDADVVIAGNSRGVAGFYAPEIEERYDVRCLNLAYNGFSSLLVRSTLEDYLEHNKTPKLVIVEATCLDSEIGNVLNLKPYWSHSSRLRKIAAEDEQKASIACRISNLFAYNTEMFFRILFFKSRTDQTWCRRTTISDELLQETKTMEPVRLEQPTENELGDLRAILELAQSHGFECKMVVAPYLPDYKAKIENWDECYEAVRRTIAKSNAAGNQRIVDLSESLSDTGYFGDRIHPNYAARKAILNALDEQGVFDVLRD